MSPGYLRSLLFTDPLIVVLTILMGTVSLVTTFFDSTGRRPHKIARKWARMLLSVSGVRVTIEGLEKIDPDGPYVFVANHRSYMDTPVVLGSVPVEFRFFAKKGLFLIPFLGTHLKRAGHLPVVRGNARESLKSMTQGAHLIRERNVSVLLFPEGGRTEGPMREFKEGAAYIAMKAGVPLLPLGIQGTRAVLPKGSGHIRAGEVLLRVGDPIPTSGMKPQDRSQLNIRLERVVAELAGQAPAASVPIPEASHPAAGHRSL
ncbi:MAG: 1-acyl-sn-glycerol-3-phosphate acyltransferase [Acidobacteria bacterium]|nr:MAG: 1-acyl-sn-glycerol-3-phosphate acyltransferase [Acidobacteriota bacterium]